MPGVALGVLRQGPGHAKGLRRELRQLHHSPLQVLLLGPLHRALHRLQHPLLVILALRTAQSHGGTDHGFNLQRLLRVTCPSWVVPDLVDAPGSGREREVIPQSMRFRCVAWHVVAVGGEAGRPVCPYLKGGLERAVACADFGGEAEAGVVPAQHSEKERG